MTNLIKNWNDQAIRIRSDRYVSLTDMAQASGKLFADWSRQAKTKSYLETLSVVMGIPITGLVQVIQGGKAQNQGTWGHPKVALRFAQWCSDDFAVQVDFWIDELLTTGKVELANSQPKTAIAHYSDRIADIRNHLTKPQGYWCVIEKCNHLLLEVERSGYAINQFDLLDSSIGKRWIAYRKEVGLNNPLKDASYLMPKRSSRSFPINAFPNEELGIFSGWLETVYEQKYLAPYLQGKYGNLAKG